MAVTMRKQGGGKIGRNEPCPCGSGKKFKACCFLKLEGMTLPRGSQVTGKAALAVAAVAAIHQPTS